MTPGPPAPARPRSGGTAGAWDHEAVADHLVHGHPLGDATFRAGEAWTPPADGPVASAISRDGKATPAHPDDAVAALRAAVGRLPVDCALSLSGGLDSRLLLAAFLAAGRRPTLHVSGRRGAFDRDVAESIAKGVGLELHAVEVTESSVAPLLAPAAMATGGVLPATNVAGLAHLLPPAGDPGPVALGANGEYARSYYAGRRGRDVALAANLPRADAGAVVAARHPPPFSAAERCLLHEALADALTPDAIGHRRAAVLTTLPGETALDVADEFFLSQYGRRKTGADLALLRSHRPVHLPYLDPDWVQAIRCLPRRWKRVDRWHRYAIDALWPSLLRFPEQGYGRRRTARRPPLHSWWRGPRPPHAPHYLDQSMFRSGPLLDLVRTHRGAIDDLIDPVLVDRLVDEQEQRGTRPHVTFALLALAHWREQVVR